MFARWKSLAQPPASWHGDPSYRVRLNRRPFLRVPDAGKEGTCMVRDRPNSNWGQR
jgi:hypothetical protein